MHAPPLTVAPRRRATRAEQLAREHEDLLLLFATLRAASATSVIPLYFNARLKRLQRSQAFAVLAELRDEHLLVRQELVSGRTIYHLGSAALAHCDRVAARVTDTFRKDLPELEAEYCWLRARIWAELVSDGYVVGRGRDEQLALRRFLVDAQRKKVAVLKGSAQEAAQRVLDALRADATLIPLFRSRCRPCQWSGPLCVAARECGHCRGPVEHVASEYRYECDRCGFASDRVEPTHNSRRDTARKTACKGAMRFADHLPFDVAWRDDGAFLDVRLVFVDDPGRDLTEQLRTLPVRIARQPKLPIILRTTDPDSVYQSVQKDWLSKGDRHRALLHAFSDDGDGKAFPFATTTTVVDDFRPGLQLNTTRRKVIKHA